MYLGLLIGLFLFFGYSAYHFMKENGFKCFMLAAAIGTDFILIAGYLWLVRSESSFRPWAMHIGGFFGALTIAGYFIDDWLLKKREGGTEKTAVNTGKATAKKKTTIRAKRGGIRGWF